MPIMACAFSEGVPEGKPVERGADTDVPDGM
jgi:hypothetical protein